MTNKNFEALFPLKGRITKDIINKADVMDIRGCRGARTLKAALGPKSKNKDIIWGTNDGYATIGKVRYRIGTKEGIDFMNQNREKNVTFIILDQRMKNS